VFHKEQYYGQHIGNNIAQTTEVNKKPSYFIQVYSLLDPNNQLINDYPMEVLLDDAIPLIPIYLVEGPDSIEWLEPLVDQYAQGLDRENYNAMDSLVEDVSNFMINLANLLTYLNVVTEQRIPESLSLIRYEQGSYTALITVEYF